MRLSIQYSYGISPLSLYLLSVTDGPIGLVFNNKLPNFHVIILKYLSNKANTKMFTLTLTPLRLLKHSFYFARASLHDEGQSENYYFV